MTSIYNVPGYPKGLNPPDAHQTKWQFAPNLPSLPSSFVDSSEPLFSLYSKVAEEEDDKTVKGWHKDIKGILIFTGLFSIAVAVLLVVTVQDLRPNSQDTSAFYLGNIYNVLASPNVTLAGASIPSSVTRPPPFSPPRYAVWVNSLLFMSLAMSLSCGLLATSVHHWARRYIRLTQPTRCSPEKRARMRAFYANGVDKMHIPWAVEGLPTLLHLSIFLFLGGLAIFLFNVDREVFICVVSWIGLFLMLYGLITLLPSIQLDSPYSTPLSRPAWLLYARIRYLFFSGFAFIVSFYNVQTWVHFCGMRDSYRDRMLGGVEKRAEETALEQSAAIDIHILSWAINALGDDDSLEKFFEAIPGMFNSKLVKDLEINFPEPLLETFWSVLDRFLGRTLTSNSVSGSVKYHRDAICRHIMSMIPCPESYMPYNLRFHFDQVPVSIESLRAIARWIHHRSRNVSYAARIRFAKNLTRIPEHDDNWVQLASDVYELPNLHKVAPSRDDSILALLIYVCCQVNRSDELGLVEAFTQFDIRHTLPLLQHDFCTLWNELIQEARIHGSYSTHVHILRLIRHHYIGLHEGTDALPTAFSPSTDSHDPILLRPSSYPLCDIATHHPDPIAQPDDSPNAPDHDSTPGGGTRLPLIEEASVAAESSSPSDLTTPRKFGANPQATPATVPVHVTSTHPREDATRQDIVAAGATPTSDPFRPASSAVGFFIPTFPPPSYVAPLLGEELPALFSSSTPRPTSNVTLPRLRARGLVNTGGISYANSAFQLLVHSPPFWNLFRELSDLKEQCGPGGSKTDDRATPLVDATVNLLEEFMLKENEPHPPQQPLQQAAGGKLRGLSDDEGAKKEHHAMDSFEPVYMYDAMKEKRNLDHLLDGRDHDADEFLGLYLDALDEELLKLRTYIGLHKPASTPSVENLEEETQSAEDLTEAGHRGYTASLVESPISRIFGGRFRSTVRVPNQPDTVTVEAWRSLRLNIQPDSVHTVQDALAQVSQSKPMQISQSSSSEATKQVLLEALPLILVLHLGRFLYDAAADGAKTINKPVQFSPELEIPLEIMVPAFGKSIDPILYKLYGVLYHHGESAGSGHYTVNVLHRVEDGGSGEYWLHIDDEAVSVVRQEDVFGGCDERVDDRCVYMLFYCRTSPSQT